MERTCRCGDGPSTPAGLVQREAHGSSLRVANDSGGGWRAAPVDLGHGQVTKWVKSSFSFVNGDCVEVASLPRAEVGVRDTKAAGGLFLRYTPGEWAAFLAGVKKGEFDEFPRSRFAAHERPPSAGGLWHDFGP